MNPADDPAAIRKRRLRYRAAHRGIREMDLIFGTFVTRNLDSFDDQQLTWLEELIDVPDQELFKWISGVDEVPDEFDTPVMARLQEFCLTARQLDT